MWVKMPTRGIPGRVYKGAGRIFSIRTFEHNADARSISPVGPRRCWTTILLSSASLLLSNQEIPPMTPPDETQELPEAFFAMLKLTAAHTGSDKAPGIGW